MNAKLVDGKALRLKLISEIKQEVLLLKSKKIYPGLATILVGNDPASKIYVAAKHKDCAEVGINSINIELDENISEEELLNEIQKLNDDTNCTGMIVQLPLPEHISVLRVLEKINPIKDADGLTPNNLGKILLKSPTLLPCTPQAIIYLLEQYKVPIKGSKIAVVGRGITVGAPLAAILGSETQNATVSLLHTETMHIGDEIRLAEIVIAAVGDPHFIKPEMIKQGAVVVDVGISRFNGKILGDVDFAVREVASLVSPNPGGVGPLTRAYLLKNVLKAAKLQTET